MLASRAMATVAVLKETLAAGAGAMLATRPDLSQKAVDFILRTPPFSAIKRVLLCAAFLDRFLGS